MEIPKIYDPKLVEEKHARLWKERGFFNARPDLGRPPYTIVIPPPNVTGSLHMGHALNNTLQDVLIRWKRMQGRDALWVPGTDHGGIATQNVVERLLKKEGKSRQSLGREKFLERMWQWRQESGDTILMQLEKLGCSLDWSKTRFTMDEVCSKAVAAAFLSLYKDGFLYADDRIVNWCPRCGTALADIEVDHEDRKGSLWHIRYPAEDGSGHVVVATTRPETMLGDTGVAVHPDDDRYKKWIGKKLQLPLTGRVIPVVADDAVDKTFGTGSVKVTPAHDATDFEIGRRHKLAQIVVIDYNGKISTSVPTYGGLDRFVAREKIVEDLKAQDLLEKVEDYALGVGVCYRCQTVIEPLTSPQWYMNMKSFAEQGLKAVQEEKVRFTPARWKADSVRWLEGLKDWCVSRQIWWGHRVPLWYCLDCDSENLVRLSSQVQEEFVMAKPGKKSKAIPSADRPAQCPHCHGKNLVQDANVLDTWFSSALWPFSVFHWPDETRDLKRYYPTSTLVTGHEILYLWVLRMVMMGLHFRKQIPFSDVFIHGIVRDKTGKKMSKSYGNVIDPLGIMAQYGTDALRFTMAKASLLGRDLQLSDSDFVSARNFANKLWNASRFVLMNLEGWKPEALKKAPAHPYDQWILSEYEAARVGVTEALETFDVSKAAETAYRFFWDTYCDWYVELAKQRLTGQDAKERQEAQTTLVAVLQGVLKLLHPIMPYITEEIWQTVKPEGSDSIMTAPWPEPFGFSSDKKTVEGMRFMTGVITAIRTVRSEMNVPPVQAISVSINAPEPAVQKILQTHESMIRHLTKAGSVQIGASLAKPAQSAVAVIKGAEIFVPLAGLIDFEKERLRLQKDLDRLLQEQESIRARLTNQDFMTHAPKTEVEKVEQKKSENHEKQEKLKQNLEMLR